MDDKMGAAHATGGIQQDTFLKRSELKISQAAFAFAPPTPMNHDLRSCHTIPMVYAR